MRRLDLRAFVFIFGLLFATPAGAAETTFDEWLQQFRQEAAASGISQGTIDDALTGLQPVMRAIQLDKKQPEKQITFSQYYNRVVTPQRIEKGREMMQRHRALLERISSQYGVEPQYIVALWGIETDFGRNTGGFSVVQALATLAWEGRRSEFFKKELINALKIIDTGAIDAKGMTGSWAGAMGQNQFMPSSYLRYAADGDGDGRKDIWTNLPDIFASTANYLAKEGWTDGERWGREVKASPGIFKHNIGLDTKKSLSEWKGKGITLPGGGHIPVEPGMEASLVAPDGVGGRVFLVYNNYRTIMKWNRSTYFATSVGLLANAIAQ